MGIDASNRDGRLVVSRVTRDTPAYFAGLNTDDELIAINGYRVPADGLDSRLDAFAPGEAVKVMISRRGQVLTLDLTLSEKPREWKLEIDADADEQQTARLDAWLGE